VCFIDGACGREDEIRRFFKELLLWKTVSPEWLQPKRN
jgi:hypothetical protein